MWNLTGTPKCDRCEVHSLLKTALSWLLLSKDLLRVSSPPRLILLRIHCSCYGGGGGVVVAVVVSEEVVVAVMVVEEGLVVMVVSLLNAAWQRAINYAFSRRHDK